MRSRPLSSFLLALVALLLSTAAAHADTVTTDFETGPALGTPVNDDYENSGFVRFVAADPGYRPYRRDVGDRARSGSTVVDVGGDVCAPESPGGGADCEFAQSSMTARLTRTASKITLYAGQFTGSPNIAARLIAFDSAGNTIATGAPVTLPENGTSVVVNPGGGAVGGAVSGASRSGRAILVKPPRFITPVTVSSASSNIASFRLEAVDADDPTQVTAAYNATLGFDDLTVDYPANSLPEFSLTSPSLTSVLAGLSTDVPITVTRLNASNGPIALSASGLPTGVTATFTPNPLPATQTAAVMHLAASISAPRLDDPADVTVTADPQSNANVGVGLRTSHTLVRVGAPYELRGAGGSTVASIGTCADTDVPFVVRRDITFTGVVHLELGALPTGVTATIDNPNIQPGGNLDADATVHVHVADGTTLPTSITLIGTSAGGLSRTLTLLLTPKGEAHLADPGQVARTPRNFQPGTTVALTGAGFCPGTQVQVGPGGGTVPATVAPDGKTLGFVTPRDATGGTVRVIPPAGDGQPYNVSEPITVDNFRNTAGFAFHNPGFSALSYGELTDAFGDDDMWITVNPCWPFGDCRFNTGIPDPLSYAEWGILNLALRSSGGHCFGISRGAWTLLTHKVAYSRFQSGVTHAFDLPSSTGPSGSLGDWLDGQHALQGSAEFLHAYAHRDRGVDAQVTTANQELSAGRYPLVTMHHDDGTVFGSGHAVLAYDMQNVPGGVDIYVYDSNRQSSPAGDPGGTNASVIHITQGNGHWEMKQAGGEDWSGGNDGSLFIAPQSSIPDNPSLPSLSSLTDLPAMIFGSDGSATVTSAGDNTTAMPVIDDGTANPSGWVLGQTAGQSLDTTITGSKAGTYSAGVTGPGFAGTVSDVSTKPGVVDQAGGHAKDHELSFKSGSNRTLEMTVATGTPSGGGARAARAAAGGGSDASVTVTTKATKGNTDTTSLSPSGALEYSHSGGATSFSLEVTTVSADGGPQVFKTPTLRQATGETLASKLPQAVGSTLTLSFRNKKGKVRKVTVRNQSKAPAKLSLAGFQLPSAKSTGRKISLTAAVAKLPANSNAVLGVTLRIKRGNKVVAKTTSSTAVTTARGVPVTWTLPASLKKGSYKLLVDARLAVGGTSGAGSVKTSKTKSFKLK